MDQYQQIEQLLYQQFTPEQQQQYLMLSPEVKQQYVQNYYAQIIQQQQQQFALQQQHQYPHQHQQQQQYHNINERNKVLEINRQRMLMIPGFKKKHLSLLNVRDVDNVNVDNERKQLEIKDYPSQRVGTGDRLTKFEVAKLISVRAVLLEQNAPPMVEIGDVVDPEKIAFMELKSGRLPMNLERPRPDGVIMTLDPNKMLLPEETSNVENTLTKDEIKKMINIRSNMLKSGENTTLNLKSIAMVELRSKQLPLSIKRNGKSLNPNKMFLSISKNKASLTNDDVFNLITVRSAELSGSNPEKTAISELKNKKLPINLQRDDSIIDPNNMDFKYIDKIESLDDILLNSDVTDLIDRRVKNLKSGDKYKYTIDTESIAMMEIKSRVIPLKIERIDDTGNPLTLDPNTMLYPN